MMNNPLYFKDMLDVLIEDGIEMYKKGEQSGIRFIENLQKTKGELLSYGEDHFWGTDMGDVGFSFSPCPDHHIVDVIEYFDREIYVMSMGPGDD